MVKNVKITSEAHRALSIRASETAIGKSELCSALVLAGLQTLDEKTIKQYVELARDQLAARTECRSPGQPP